MPSGAGHERFLIKGISYHAYRPETSEEKGELPHGPGPHIDPSTEDRLVELEKDIPLIRYLGFNSISVSGLDPSADHSNALRLLEKNGIYVLTTLFEDMMVRTSKLGSRETRQPDDEFSGTYTSDHILNAFRLLDELSRHPNVLGFAVQASLVFQPNRSRVAEVIRACVRDLKAFLRHRGIGHVPVGVFVRGQGPIEVPELQYFTAGSPEERVDFYGHECWTWVSPSDFKISGWKDMVARYGPTSPVPMFFSEYGAKVRERSWDEVSCLYSPHMTQTHSGGFAYTFLEGANPYGMVRVDQQGRRWRRKEQEREWSALGKRTTQVSVQLLQDIAPHEVKLYERVSHLPVIFSSRIRHS